jgi:nucleoside-diphosphate-sugar epimerase
MSLYRHVRSKDELRTGLRSPSARSMALARARVQGEHMRILVLGGTKMVGHAVAADALARGHDVVCAARGESGPVPDGATLLKIDRDVSHEALEGERFDAVVDMATISYPWVAGALAALAKNAGHWTFVSTINVYSDVVTFGQGPDAPLLDPREEPSTGQDPDEYGAIKVASENAVRDAMGDKAFIVRPGLITGARDSSDRFGYWPGRFARGGRVLVPHRPEQPAQYIDVEDLARWIVDASEQRIAGTYDGIGPHTGLSELLSGIAAAVGASVEFVEATPAQLAEAEINPWGGPRSLPLWTPDTHTGFLAHDPSASIDAGLRLRPLDEAVASALAREQELGLDRERRAGLSLAEEKDALDRIG